MFKIIVFLFVTNILSKVECLQEEANCTSVVCPTLDNGKINVHIIPHSHDDVGWLKTVDQYYYGVSTEISVQSIISAVLQSLKMKSSRRFTQVETAYFWRWWQDQSESVKNDYQYLVKNGQIEIVNGAWVMNDEACTHYHSIIDQFTLGLRKIQMALGDCGYPKIGWQIDTFGHSRQQAQIYKQLGFDGVFFARLDYRDRIHRMMKKSMDFLWKSSANIENSEIFYSVLMDHYNSPLGFCFDALCSDDPIVDGKYTLEANADKKFQEFEQILDIYTNFTTTNNLLIPMGGDFNFQIAEMQYSNIDKLINLFEGHEKYNLFYSTPSCYVKAVREASKNLTVKTDDFFPYASAEHEYWTGYFTSRPNLKRTERLSQNILQANKFLRAIFRLKTSDSAEDGSNLMSLQESISILQHHDAITGTERHEIAEDYRERVVKAVTKTEESVGEIIGRLLSKAGKSYNGLEMSSCLLNETCENSMKNRFVVAVYNPLSKAVSSVIRLPVEKNVFSVVGKESETEFEVVDSIGHVDTHNNTASAGKDLLINAKNVPPMGINLYYVTAKDSQNRTHNEDIKAQNLTFGTKETYFTLDDISYKLKSVTMRNVTLEIEQDFYYYQSENGEHDFVASGAYIFRPLNGTDLKRITYQPGTLEYTHRGNLVEEAHIKINEWIKQIIRVYKTEIEPHIEFEWLVGPIEVNDTSLSGKEIVTTFKIAEFKNNGIFYTDSNGREMIRRMRNSRLDYDFTASDEPVSSNYYPITSKILIRDEERNLEVAVLNDRSQGGSSLVDGKIELMIHRRLLVDDNKGLGEALNDGSVVKGKHILVFGRTDETNVPSLRSSIKNLELKNVMTPYTVVADATADSLTLEKLQTELTFQFEFLKKSLPDNVNVLSFEEWDGTNSFLLRLEHILEKDEDPILSKDIEINLNEVFETKITSIKETTLGANVWLEEDGAINASNITLAPIQIRTFILKF